MTTAAEAQELFTNASIDNKYFQRVEVQDKSYEYNGKTGVVKAFQIFYDLTPDFKHVNQDNGLIRLDYEISDETIDDNLDRENFAEHLVRLFWTQVAYDIANSVVNENEHVNLEVTGEVPADIQENIDRLKSEAGGQ